MCAECPTSYVARRQRSACTSLRTRAPLGRGAVRGGRAGIGSRTLLLAVAKRRHRSSCSASPPSKCSSRQPAPPTMSDVTLPDAMLAWMRSRCCIRCETVASGRSATGYVGGTGGGAAARLHACHVYRLRAHRPQRLANLVALESARSGALAQRCPLPFRTGSQSAACSRARTATSNDGRLSTLAVGHSSRICRRSLVLRFPTTRTGAPGAPVGAGWGGVLVVLLVRLRNDRKRARGRGTYLLDQRLHRQHARR
jgi:hypothetical protein